MPAADAIFRRSLFSRQFSRLLLARAAALLFVVGPVFALGVAGAAPPAAKPRIKPLFTVKPDPAFPKPEATLEEVVKLVLDNYYTDDVDRSALLWGAVKGVLRQISPPENPNLAAIWTPEQYEKVEQSLSGVQESIGIRSSFNPNDGSLTVTDVMPGGPSESLLEPYDRIVRIDGLPLKGRPVAEIDSLLKGKPGTKVSLKIVRDVAVFDLVVTRAEVHVDNVVVTDLPNRVLLAEVRRFSKEVSKTLTAALDKHGVGQCAGVIVDVRGNGGGLLAEALKTAELFVPKKKRLLRIVTHGSKIQDYVSGNETPLEVPLAVLIDHKSASASEILAAALKDSAGALLIGGRSFGKASMERTFPLENGYHVRFTIGALYSPAGRSWQKNGLVPDIPVAGDPDRLKVLRRLPVARRLAEDGRLRAAWRLLEDVPEPAPPQAHAKPATGK
ncbi:MAG: PDZ domain-containing protein [Kiritimatiellaeota bacterium]|nr:PDZ domain-containing protein [Kiritimatiellota bacterium]